MIKMLFKPIPTYSVFRNYTKERQEASNLTGEKKQSERSEKESESKWNDSNYQWFTDSKPYKFLRALLAIVISIKVLTYLISLLTDLVKAAQKFESACYSN